MIYETYIMNSLQDGPKWLSKYNDKERRKQKHREYQRKYRRNYRLTHPDYKSTKPDYQKRLRIRAIEKLGGPRCVNCGCEIKEILEINHIKGNGRKERKKYRNYHTYFRDIINEKLNIRDYNVLCRVCNAKYYVEQKYGISGYEVKFTPR